jgi:hypothetical protein
MVKALRANDEGCLSDLKPIVRITIGHEHRRFSSGNTGDISLTHKSGGINIQLEFLGERM